MTVPHGLFDALGLGMVSFHEFSVAFELLLIKLTSFQILKAIDAELTGREWSPPPVSDTNSLARRIEEITAECTTLPFYRTGAERRHLATGTAKSYWDFARLIFSLVKEKLWYQASLGEAFIGREIFEKVVAKVKEDVKVETGGSEWVSTADVLVAWTQKVRQNSPLPSMQGLNFSTGNLFF